MIWRATALAATVYSPGRTILRESPLPNQVFVQVRYRINPREICPTVICRSSANRASRQLSLHLSLLEVERVLAIVEDGDPGSPGTLCDSAASSQSPERYTSQDTKQR